MRSRSRLALLIVGVVVGAAALWALSVSPVALSSADLLLSLGMPRRAVVVYERVARSNVRTDVRSRALDRAAMIYAVQLGQPERALDCLQDLMRSELSRPARAEVLARIGAMQRDAADPAKAAQRFREAHDLDPAAAAAAARLAQSARASLAAGQPRRADRSWRRLADRHPVFRGTASLERGHLKLRRGDVRGALQLYHRAVDTSFDSDVQDIATLGINTCRVRLRQ